MSNLKTLILMSLVAGLTAPVLADDLSSNPSGEPSDLQLLYDSIKQSGDDAPAWLIEKLFPEAVIDDPNAPVGADRQGGTSPATAVVIPGLPYSDTGSTTSASGALNSVPATAYTTPTICAQVGPFYTSTARDRSYRITLASPTSLNIDLCSSGYDTALGVFAAVGSTLGACVARDDDSCGSNYRSKILSCTLPAGDYFIIVDGYGSSTGGNYSLSVSNAACNDPGCPVGYDLSYEAEPNGADTNGGCNMAVPAFEPIVANLPLCGTTWANANLRDTDWFELILTQSSIIRATLATGCVPMSVIVADAACPTPTQYATAAVAAGTSGTATSICLLPGRYHIIALPQGTSGFPVTGNYHYGLSVTTESCVHPCDLYTCTPLAPIQSVPYVMGNTTGKPNVAGNLAPDDFYCFTPDFDCPVTFTTCDATTLFAPSNDTYLRLWSVGGPCGGGTQLIYNDDSPCAYSGLLSTLTYNVVAGQSYVLQVEGYGSNAGPYKLNITGDCIFVDAQDVPTAFSLLQNVPNPFNPTTTINFSAGETGEASLKVYDVAGREVATLVSGLVERGEHSITFDASNLSSGVYFYTLQANGTVETKKMVLMK